MSEPGPLTAAGGIALYKLGAFGFVAVLAAVVVMAMTLPKTVREFVVAMISTSVSSICGGAFVVRWLDLGSWANDDVGVIALGGIIFVCGLPAWVLVRAWFKWAEKRRDKDLTEIASDLAELRKAVTGTNQQQSP
jgi:quinol-cytochrome oxidoreductase complex cytochrome b subunit